MTGPNDLQAKIDEFVAEVEEPGPPKASAVMPTAMDIPRLMGLLVEILKAIGPLLARKP